MVHEELLKLRFDAVEENDSRPKMFGLVKTRDIGVTKFNFLTMFIQNGTFIIIFIFDLQFKVYTLKNQLNYD